MSLPTLRSDTPTRSPGPGCAGGLKSLVALVVVGCASGGPGVEPPLEETTFSPGLEVALERMTHTPSGVYMEDLREGQGEEARRGRRLTVHYQGWFPDGRLFDSTRESGGPVSFTLGRREVIQGWEEGLEGMRVGGLRRLVVPSRMGYGRRGVEGLVPPDAALVFEIELLQVGDRE